jgi:predicted MFS family arabinose efflux permease
MVAAGGGAVGLILGGLLTQYIDWRWIFFINVPLAVVVLIAARLYIPASPPVEKQRLDIIGALSITASLMTLVYGLAKAPDLGWTNASTLGSFAAAIILMAVFIINELRVKQPLITLSIFRRRNVSGGSLIQLLMPAAMFGMFFYITIYLQQILSYSPTLSGAANIPFTLTIMIVAGILSSKISKINPKMVLVIAPWLVVAGLLYFARIPVQASYLIDILPGIILMGTGMAAVFVTTTLITTSGVSHKESGLVSGLLNTGQQVGGAIGLAVLTVVSTAVTKSDMIAASGNQAALPAALVHGFQRGFVVAALFAAAASLVALFVLRAHKPSASDLAREPEVEAESLAAIPGA